MARKARKGKIKKKRQSLSTVIKRAERETDKIIRTPSFKQFVKGLSIVTSSFLLAALKDPEAREILLAFASKVIRLAEQLRPALPAPRQRVGWDLPRPFDRPVRPWDAPLPEGPWPNEEDL